MSKDSLIEKIERKIANGAETIGDVDVKTLKKEIERKKKLLKEGKDVTK